MSIKLGSLAPLAWLAYRGGGLRRRPSSAAGSGGDAPCCSHAREVWVWRASLHLSVSLLQAVCGGGAGRGSANKLAKYRHVLPPSDFQLFLLDRQLNFCKLLRHFKKKLAYVIHIFVV
jgi:hypothetical protein